MTQEQRQSAIIWVPVGIVLIVGIIASTWEGIQHGPTKMLDLFFVMLVIYGVMHKVFCDPEA